MDLNEISASLREASSKLALHNANQKNAALLCVAESINKHRSEILVANKIDMDKSREKGMSEALLERLMLNEKRIDGIIDSMKIVVSQNDPIGEVVAGWNTTNGMSIKQVRVPLGVVAIIYESRPNVTVDAFCLAYKSGNSILLRGSSSAVNSNLALVKAIKEGLIAAGENGVEKAIELFEPMADHSDVDAILTAVGKIDCVLPRGGKNLIQRVVQNAKIPVIETGSGVCHLFVDETADLEKAAKIAENAKIQRPGACNAIECILVHEKIADTFLPKLVEKLNGRVELRCDEKSYGIIDRFLGSARNDKNAEARNDSKKQAVISTGATAEWKNPVLAQESDYGFEFLDLTCLVHIVKDCDEAIEYINSHSTKHSESIVTECRANARAFQQKIDSACVYVNASTRFTDGGEFGFGAEVGISTQKLHARGPMGIKALTTTKFLIDGDGQVR